MITEAVVAQVCDLCGLDCGASQLRTSVGGQERRFCCAGCLNVYAILAESGTVAPGVDLRETDLFRRSRDYGLVSNTTATRSAAIPHEALRQERLFHITGMWCSSCAWLIEHALGKERGVESVDISFASDTAKVRYCPQYVSPDHLVRRIESLGYRVDENTDEIRAAESRDLLIRLGVAAFLWMNVMTLNAVIYVGYVERLPGSVRAYLPVVLMALATPAVFYSARPILRLAWAGLRKATLRMETLLSLGILTGWGCSVVATVRGSGHIYFDTVCAIVTLVMLGKWIERSAKEKAARAIASLHRSLPSKVRLQSGDREKFVAIEALTTGEIFVVKPGERVPADGVVVAGESYVDESLVTGESTPVSKTAGRSVFGGSFNDGGVLQVRATKVGTESRLSQIVTAVARALETRSPIERTVDRVSRLFLPAVLLIAALTCALALATGAGADEAIMRAVAVLVIACPCALGIATPLAITSAIAAATRRGILVNDSSVLETISKVDVMVLDKTGTVTEGNFALLQADPADLPTLAALEAYSEHPLGAAVSMALKEHALTRPYPATAVRIHKGRGIEGLVAGVRVVIGNRNLVGGIPSEIEKRAQDWERTGATVAFYAMENRVRGFLAFGDRIREGARELVSSLRRAGIRVALVSGDSRVATEWTAARIAADEQRSGALPEDKVIYVESLRRSGRVVAMAGDGINDAPALAAADLGIAMGRGTDIAMNAASVVLMNNSLLSVLSFFDIAHRTLRVVRQNIFWAFVYNVAAISLAASGLLTPIFAAVAMVLSSLSVLANSARLSAHA